MECVSRRAYSEHVTQTCPDRPAPTHRRPSRRNPSCTSILSRVIPDPFSLSDLSSLSDIRFRQPDRNLRTLLPAQLRDQSRTSHFDAFRMLLFRLPLHIVSTCRASPPLGLVTLALKLRYLNRPPRHLFACEPPAHTVAPLSRIQIVGRHHALDSVSQDLRKVVPIHSNIASSVLHAIHIRTREVNNTNFRCHPAIRQPGLDCL